MYSLYSNRMQQLLLSQFKSEQSNQQLNQLLDASKNRNFN